MNIDEHLPVERIALRFVRLVEPVAQGLPHWREYLAVQMRRAALSVYLNVREGVGEFSPGDKARFYRMALRSLREATGCLIVASTLHPDLRAHAESALDLARDLAPTIGRMARFHGTNRKPPRTG